MAAASFFRLVCMFLLILTIRFSFASALISSPDVNPPYPKAISDLKETVVKRLGLQADDLKISGFDFREALVGRSMVYEFDLEIDNKVSQYKLLKDVKRWEYVDLPIFWVDDPVGSGDGNGLVMDRSKDNDGLTVLAPFQLAGPMELWIQDAKDMRLSLPHDVDAGVLKKVILADGAVVTVKGARSVSLRHSLDLPLPLNRSRTGFASGLLALAEHLRRASQTPNGQILSLRIVGPTSLTSPISPSSPSSTNKLKLKRLAPGLVELSAPSKTKPVDDISTVGSKSEALTLHSPRQFSALWPVTSINGSNSNLVGLEELLFKVLDSRAGKKGSFKLLKADISAEMYVKIGFRVEKELRGDGVGEGLSWEGFPEWRTRPGLVKKHFEVLAKVQGDKVVPESVVEVDPFMVEDTVAPSVVNGNATMSKMPILLPPFSPFSL